MNIKACFYFLSFYQLKIRDRSFYEFCSDAARGINFAQHESNIITAEMIYKNILKENVDNPHFHMGYVIGLCLRAPEITIENVHTKLWQNHDYVIKHHLYFREALGRFSHLKRKTNLVKQYCDFNFDNDIQQYDFKRLYMTQGNFSPEYIISLVNNKIGYDINRVDRLRRELLALAYSYIECAEFQSEQAGIMAYYNMTSLTYYINEKYQHVILLKDILCVLREGFKPQIILKNNSFKRYHYMFDKVSNCDMSIIDIRHVIREVARNVEYEFFMFDETTKAFFVKLIENSNIDENVYTHIKSAIQYDRIVGNPKKSKTAPPPLPTVVNEQKIEKVPNMDMNTGIFAVGVKTIDKMNTISMEISNEDAEQMSNVIMGLKNSVEKYKKYANIGWWGKIFTSALEVQTNMTIAVLDFENLMKKGDALTKSLSSQYDAFYSLHADLKNLHDQFDADIQLLDGYLKDDQYSDSDKQRLLRRRNDLLAAQTLSTTTAMQYEMAKNNIGILIDKFIAIEKILKPAIEMNMKLDSSQFNSISKYF